MIKMDNVCKTFHIKRKANIVYNNSFCNKLYKQVIVLIIKYLNDNLLLNLKKALKKYQMITGNIKVQPCHNVY